MISPTARSLVSEEELQSYVPGQIFHVWVQSTASHGVVLLHGYSGLGFKRFRVYPSAVIRPGFEFFCQLRAGIVLHQRLYEAPPSYGSGMF